MNFPIRIPLFDRMKNVRGYALVDSDDWWIVQHYHWSFDGSYAVAHLGRGKKVYLHRLVLGLTSRKKEIHHKNRDKLDCRRSNLEVMVRSEHRALHCREMLAVRDTAKIWRTRRLQRELDKIHLG